MTTIQERAAEKAARAATAEAAAIPVAADMPIPAVDPMADYEPGDDDPEMVPVHIAWLRVRREIRSIAKREQPESGIRFHFRGVDTVVKHFGPVTLRHGVNVLPIKIEMEDSEQHSKANSRMRECVAIITWQIMGPRGDFLTLQTAGEALDVSDKSTTKAQSVALRTLLLTAGLTPTDDPDPDSSYVERGEAPMRPLTEYRDEILENEPSRARMVQIMGELRQQRRSNELITNENGDDETISAFVTRKGDERGFGGGAS